MKKIPRFYALRGVKFACDVRAMEDYAHELDRRSGRRRATRCPSEAARVAAVKLFKDRGYDHVRMLADTMWEEVSVKHDIPKFYRDRRFTSRAVTQAMEAYAHALDRAHGRQGTGTDASIASRLLAIDAYKQHDYEYVLEATDALSGSEWERRAEERPGSSAEDLVPRLELSTELVRDLLQAIEWYAWHGAGFMLDPEDPSRGNFHVDYLPKDAEPPRTAVSGPRRRLAADALLAAWRQNREK